MSKIISILRQRQISHAGKRRKATNCQRCMQAGFEHVCEIEGVEIFRKHK